MSAAALLSQQILDLTFRVPFLGQCLSALPRSADPQVPGTCLRRLATQIPGLAFAPQYVNEQSAEALQGALLHELLHLILKHPQETGGIRYPFLGHLAADWVVHTYLEALGVRGDFPPTFWQELDCQPPPGSWGATYAVLLEVKQEVRELIQSDEYWNMAISRHQYWAEVAHEDAWLRPWFAERASSAESTLGWGTLPGALQAQLAELWVPAGLPWPRLLQQFLLTAATSHRGTTLHRLSRRYGIPPALRTRPRCRILVVLDTSASISEKQLAAFWQEIRIAARQTAEWWVAEADTQVQRLYPFRGQLPATAQGRGGTSFDPALQLAATQLRPDGIIYFTDGEGPTPQQQTGCPILWMLVGPRRPLPLPGQLVWMDDPLNAMERLNFSA